MKYCSICGMKNSTEAKFCARCGNPISDTKQTCNQLLSQDTEDASITENDLMIKALRAYDTEYSSFKKRWMIAIVITGLGTLAACGCAGILTYVLYSFIFLPRYERKLLARYKSEHLQL